MTLPSSITTPAQAPRCFLPLALRPGDSVTLPESAFRHLIQVLRLSPDAPIILFNGQGGEYRARLTTVERRCAVACIESFSARDVESPLAVTLLQAVGKGERMDYALQKAVELGVSAIVPVWAEHGVVKKSAAARLQNRLQHWRGVIASACEQSGRNRLPTLDAPLSFAAALASASRQDYATRLLLHPGGALGLKQLQRPVEPGGRIALLVGPEGGWTAVELACAQRAGWLSVRLGPRVLRTETAGVCALAALQALWGDLS